MTCISKTVGHREKLCKLWDSWIVIIHNYMGSGTGSIPELELELFMSKLGGIGIGFGIVHLGIGIVIGIGHFGIGIVHLGIGIGHAQCAIS